MPLATTEPASFYAGDTVQWKITLTDYPATSYTLKYVFVKSGAQITVSSSADGTDHLVTLGATATALYSPGEYRWRSYVDNVGTFSTRNPVAQGILEIKANLTTSTSGYDWRSAAKKIIDALEAALAGDTSATNLTVISQSCGDLNISRRSDVHAELMKWKAIYQAETDKENIENGRGTKRAIYTRFNTI